VFSDNSCVASKWLRGLHLTWWSDTVNPSRQKKARSGLVSRRIRCDESRSQPQLVCGFFVRAPFRRLDEQAQAWPVRASGFPVDQLVELPPSIGLEAAVFANRTCLEAFMAKSSRALAHLPTQAASAAIPPNFTIPPGAGAVLVFEDGANGLKFQPVARNASVFNIESDLLKHLNEQPFSVEWLAVLRDYCDSRIAARNRAKATDSIITPSQSFDWDMTRLAALRGVQS
jgi:hypothetical protein